MLKILWADSARGLAASSVVIAHLMVGFWLMPVELQILTRQAPIYPDATSAPTFARIIGGLPFSFAAFGVALFFLISGLVIAPSLSKYSRIGFIVGRGMRIFPTYAAGFALTCTAIAMAGDPNRELNLKGVLAGAFPGFSQIFKIDSPADGIVWTIIVELIFYVVCVLNFKTLAESFVAPLCLTISCAALQFLLSLFDGDGEFSGVRHVILLATPFMPLMFLGVCIYIFRSKGRTKLSTVLVIFFIAFTHVILLAFSPLFHVDLVYQVSVLLAIVTVVIWGLIKKTNRQNSVLKLIAKISYPLYVIHPVVGYALMAFLYRSGWTPTIIVLVTLSTILLLSVLVHISVETPTHLLGQRMAKRITISKSAKPLSTRN